MKRPALSILAAVLLSTMPGTAAAETFNFDATLLGKTTRMSGDLLLPEGASGKVPVMILVHGSGGKHQYREYRYAKALNKIGVGALVTDHFSPRGIKSTVEDQSKINWVIMMSDAYAALNALAKHPKVNGERIGIAGFSLGGIVALYSSMNRFKVLVSRSPRQFALHIPVYPGCNIVPGKPTQTGAPVAILLGGADDYTGVSGCMKVYSAIRAGTAAVSVKIYPGAGHGWDGVSAWKSPKAQVFRKCILKEAADGSFVDTKSGLKAYEKTMRPAADLTKVAMGCMKIGATGGLHAPTKAQSLRDFLGIVRANLMVK